MVIIFDGVQPKSRKFDVRNGYIKILLSIGGER